MSAAEVARRRWTKLTSPEEALLTKMEGMPAVPAKTITAEGLAAAATRLGRPIVLETEVGAVYLVETPSEKPPKDGIEMTFKDIEIISRAVDMFGGPLLLIPKKEEDQ
jgi:hypothetical protein